MPDEAGQSDVDHRTQRAGIEPLGDETEFNDLVAAMVADQAPRLFAVVIERRERLDAQIVAWGLALDDCANMITLSNHTQYLLAEPENGLRYVRRTDNTTPHLVWVGNQDTENT